MGFEAGALPRRLYVYAAVGSRGRFWRCSPSVPSDDRRHRRDLHRRRDLLLPGAAQRRPPRAMACEEEPARPLGGAQARCREHPSSRRADAVRRAVARTRTDAARHAGADRRQSQAADRRQPARAGTELLLRRHTEHRGRQVRGVHREGSAIRRADARAYAERAGSSSSTASTCRRSRFRRRAPGCCAATAA